MSKKGEAMMSLKGARSGALIAMWVSVFVMAFSPVSVDAGGKKLKEFIEEERSLCLKIYLTVVRDCVDDSMARIGKKKVDEKKFSKGDPVYEKCTKKALDNLDKCQDPKALKKKARLAKNMNPYLKKREKELDKCKKVSMDCYYDCRAEKGKAFKKCTGKCTKKLEKCNRKADNIALEAAKKFQKVK
jgi:hypothetical protein